MSNYACCSLCKHVCRGQPTHHTSENQERLLLYTNLALCSFVVRDFRDGRMCTVAFVVCIGLGTGEPRVGRGPAAEAVRPHVKYTPILERV